VSTNRRRKPLATFEYGTRVYAPSEGEARYRVVATGADGRRTYFKTTSEKVARERARDIETRLASSVALPGRANAPITVGHLIDRYLLSLESRSTRYVERQEYLLRIWVRPVLDAHSLEGWTPSDSELVLDRARRTLAPSTVQNVGAAMRSLVTFAFKNRWLPREADPMWLVRYSPRAEIQGEAIGHITRSSLPTDRQCAALFAALESAGHHQWAVAMNLKHRSGVRWGELIALRSSDLDFEGSRVVRVERAVEQSRTGLALKSTKNRQRRATTFPGSLADPLRELCDRVERQTGSDGLLFPSATGGYANRRTFQRTFARAAREAGWPMKRDTSSIWHVHDLRHVAACWLLFDVKLDPAAVSTLLGHANAAFTLSRYVGVRGDLAATASAATDAW
jgi:integrase